MQRYHVRKVKIGRGNDQPDAWRKQMKLVDTETLRQLISAWVSTASPALVRWGGLASMAGGVLWIVLFVSLQLGTVHGSHVDIRVVRNPLDRWQDLIPSYVDTRFLAIPMLLFLVGLVCLYVHNRPYNSRLGDVGFLLSFTGILIASANTLSNDYPYGLMESFLGRPDPIAWWLYGSLYGLILLSAGLTLAGIASIRVSTLPALPAVSLLISSVALYVVPSIVILVGLSLDIYIRRVEDWLYQVGVFPVLALWFGVSWIWLGHTLRSPSLRSQSKVTSKVPN